MPATACELWERGVRKDKEERIIRDPRNLLAVLDISIILMCGLVRIYTCWNEKRFTLDIHAIDFMSPYLNKDVRS